MRKVVNCLTINTDASFNGTYKKGGYAFYIVCNEFKIQKSGAFRVDPQNPEEAEIMAIGNAITTLLLRPDLPKAKFLIINSDCMNGMNKIKKANRGGLPRKVSGMKNKLVSHLGNPKFEFRHVKAHNGHPDARSWVNDWCDREAKKHMRASVDKLLKNGEIKKS